MTILDYVADMFRRLIAAFVFFLLLGLLLVGFVGGVLLVGWLLAGAHT